jgi:hypothetical protein
MGTHPVFCRNPPAVLSSKGFPYSGMPSKLGHDPNTLLVSPSWAQSLIHSDAQAIVRETMARMLDKDAEGDSIEFRAGTRVIAQCVETEQQRDLLCRGHVARRPYRERNSLKLRRIAPIS